jgi:hypothetical protein
MWVTDSMIRDIDVQYKTTGLEYAPKIFLVAGIGVLSLGAYLAKIAPQSKVRRARDYER